LPVNSAADVLAAVIEREPPFTLLPPTTPASVRRLLRRCLEKDPERRLAFILDARLELYDVAAEPLLDTSDRTAPSRWPIAVLSGLLALMTIGAALGWLVLPQRAAPVTTSRLVMPLPAGDEPVLGYQPMAALSPDGQTLVYRARRAKVTQLFRRDLRALDASPVPGTEGSTSPFFSPDGRWLGFDADGVLKRVSLAGGTPVTICPAPGGLTAAWLADDTIIFATNTTRVLQRVAASGGTPETLSALDHARGDTLHLLPASLPGGKAILFTVVSGAARFIATLDLASRAVRVITEGAHPRFVGDGYLVFAREGALWGARFDAQRIELAGKAAPLDERVAHTDNAVFHYGTSANGSLAYLPPQASFNRQRLVWMDRAGKETPVDLEPRGYLRVSLAPDGTRMALAVEEDNNTDIWIADPSRHTVSRLTFESTIETMPTWSPDGRYVAFRSEREGPGLFRRDAQGTGVAERLSVTDGPIHSPYSWTPDGKTLLLAVFRSFRQQAIGSVTPPETTVRVLLDGEFAQLDPQVSPDGGWMAYQSDETGRFEIYVRPYPGVESGRWLISTAGGTSPRWSPDGRELFYYEGEGIARVAIQGGTAFAAGPPVRFITVKPFGGRLGPDFEISPDGQRFLFLLPGPAAAPTVGLVVVQNIVQELRARLGS
jgi:eukaryotic-like serine/threonine-protein kinase